MIATISPYVPLLARGDMPDPVAWAVVVICLWGIVLMRCAARAK